MGADSSLLDRGQLLGNKGVVLNGRDEGDQCLRFTEEGNLKLPIIRLVRGILAAVVDWIDRTSDPMGASLTYSPNVRPPLDCATKGNIGCCTARMDFAFSRRRAF
jgi:hypothetical protein